MSKLYCGFAEADITPEPTHHFMDGYGFRLTPAEGVRDPLYAKICAIRSGENVFVIISMDICNMAGEFGKRMRMMIKALTGLKEEQFAVCATHTHAGPSCGGLGDLPANWMYWKHVAIQVSDAVMEALASTCAGEFRYAFGSELQNSYNRRGKDIIDRRVFVCGFFDESNTLRGVIGSPSCHCVCNVSQDISADYPGVLTQRAAEIYPGVPFLFLQGRGADIDPIAKKEEGLLVLGNEYADSVFAAIEKMGDSVVKEGQLRSIYRSIPIPLAYPPREELEKGFARAKEEVAAAQTPVDRRIAEVELFWFIQALSDVDEGKELHTDANLQMLCIGREAVFAFVSFEMLTVTGNTIEKMLTDMGIAPERCFVIGYANGTNGYLTPSDEVGAGDYETENATHWYIMPWFRKDSEGLVLDAMNSMAKELLEK